MTTQRDNQQQIDVEGNNNTVAGRDIIINQNYNWDNADIDFYAQDLDDLLNDFQKVFNRNNREKNYEKIKRTDIETKNRINKLTESYFNYINKQYLPYFHQIDLFLKDPENDKLLSNYNYAVDEINDTIMPLVSSVEHFDTFFHKLMLHVINQNSCIDSKRRKLYRIFFHYMYWNCDIGENEND